MSFSEPPPPSVDAVTMARMEGKLDLVLDRVQGLHNDSKDHETRLRTVEAAYVTRAAVLTWLTLLGGLMTAVIALLALILKP